ncbi:hypothetical protein CFC21_038260 [Triticum aestivum]|uniref:F-box domain-containing protein n=2 Tax=Triticum aestivum TaxID=4565 RepID=A0A9R1FD19_WHEAT|nr:hypothetical protein CFC21_038260 [Triticum aestivum]
MEEAAATAVQLPDEVLRKIFLLVKDTVALFRCATACKRWCSLLVSDPSFLRRCLPEDACRSSPFPGFFAQQRRPRGLPEPCFVQGPRPVFGLLDCPRLVGCADSAVPLTSRGVLLLVRVGDLPVLCNPLTGRFKSLPPLKLNYGSSNYSTGYAILTATDCSSSEDGDGDGDGDELSFFKVLIMIIQKDTMQYRLHTFSSAGDWGWSTCAGRVNHNLTKTGDVSTAKLPIVIPRDPLSPKTHDEPYFSLDAEGRLTLFSLQLDCNQLDIWTWHDDGRPVPTLLKLDPPSKKKKKTKAGRGVEYACLGEKNGTLLIKDDQQRVYAVSVKTGVMQEVADCPRGGVGRREIVPLEIDWPALIVSRLRELAME